MDVFVLGLYGNTGPTIFLIKGNTHHRNFKDKWLIENSTSIGSTVIMTQTVFMTEEAWGEATPRVVTRLQNAAPVVDVNQDWWMLEMFDDVAPTHIFFESHVPSFHMCPIAIICMI
jgi:hypothetical protein